MATNVQDFGGYNCLFVSEPPDVYTCLICTFVAKDCQQMDCCGKIYCTQCLAENGKYTNKKQLKECPNCRQNGNSFNDKRSDREIKALKVKCDNLDSGCQWVGELRSFEQHINACGFNLMPCTLTCKEEDGKIVKVLLKDLANHLTNKCPRRPYGCPRCEEIGEYKEMTTLHLDSCPKVKVQCPNTLCQDNVLRGDVSTHRSLCAYEKVTCMFSDIGCQERPFRKSLKEHEEDHTPHLPLIIANSLVLKNKTREVEARNNQLYEHMQTLEKRSYEQGEQIQVLEKGNNEQSELIQMLECRLRIVSSNLPFTFRMADYTRHRDQEDDFSSTPFYSAGYRFCVSISAGGNGAGRGTHLSVHTHLMKGENDDSLTWPFTGSVTIELLNQLKDKNHHQVITRFTADSNCSERVTNSDIGTGWGLAQFISNKLIVKPTSDCQYHHKDSLVFRVCIKVPEHKPWLQCTV